MIACYVVVPQRRQNGSGAGTSHLSLPPELCDSCDQAARYHILFMQVWGFISDPALRWKLQTNEVSFILYVPQDRRSR
jgi:hypothetical protein